MDSEQPIEAVRARPILYQNNRKSYKYADKKREAWREVVSK